MTTIDRAARGFQDELRRQGCLYEFDPTNPDFSKLMMNTGEAADLPAAIRAAFQAIREPSDVMINAGASGEFAERPYPGGEDGETQSANIAGIWQAMVDAALAEQPE